MKRSLLHAEGAINIEELATRDLGRTSTLLIYFFNSTEPNHDEKRRHSSPVEDRERYVDA